MPVAAIALALLQTFELPEHRFALDLSELEEVELQGTGEHGVQATWNARLGSSALSVELWVGESNRFGFREPFDVVRVVEDEARKSGAHELAGVRHLQGPFGFASYTSLGTFRDANDAAASQRFVLGGLFQEHGYAVVIDAKPSLDEASYAQLMAFFESAIEYDGPVRDARWTDEEANARWNDDAPERVLEQDSAGFIRTDHYIILTNMRASGGTAKKFGKKMEECYAAIRKVFPFEDTPGERLLPVYLFKTDGQYHLFLQETLGRTAAQAKRSGGVAYSDVYATSYSAPNDPVHIHEATHQIFRNRLRLGGGGSWFQEGVAEYIELKPNQRKLFRKTAKKEQHVPFRDFMQLKSLLYSNKEDKKGGNAAGDAYLQAACVIEFARESKWAKKKFAQFIDEVGRVPRGDLKAIDAALVRVYGVGVDGFEEQFLKYWKKR